MCRGSYLHENLRDEIRRAWEEEDAPFLDECAKETNVDPQIPKKMYKDLHFPNEESFHCYVWCLYNRQNALTPDGKDIEVEVLAMHPYVGLELAQRCVEEAKNETDICLKTYVATVCAIGHHA
ncbi:hypothetical protein PPYR_02489 [Photinus pyralis]|uniref:Uncharacterized protein n=1 Tax=Photinus pyralis TaxID=7054 RepID=A0A5N4B7E0_PHOPY|nr:uncharacterized protein LOC116170147 isoform X2 [Photinus pyralis]KAB0805519.1 hypothetical protein PPYR_02489 [Photinus pyralis]